jgi:hypothetical protein
MMWILIILAVHVNNPKDIPGQVTLEFPTQQACEQARTTMTSWLKFDSFKVIAQCKKQS